MTFTKKLTVYAAATAITLVAWVLNVGQLYWMAGMMLLLPQVSRLFGLWEHRGIAVTRRLPSAGHLGEAVPVELRVENSGPIPRLNLSVADELPRGLRVAESGAIPVHLPPHGGDTARYVLQLRRRGAHVISGVLVESADLLGLCVLRSRVPLDSSILVYPRVIALPSGVVPPELGGGRAPLESSRRKGEGSSFHGIREYRPGDPLRHVHWRTVARLGRLAVTEWEAEQSTDALLAVETREGTDRPLDADSSTLDVAAGVAASLASGILGAGDSLRLLAPGAAEWEAAARRGIDAMPELLELLARMTAAGSVPLAFELRRVLPQLAPGTVVCWITADPGEDLVDTARFLRAAHVRPVVYALLTADLAHRQAWSEIRRSLESLQIPVIPLPPEHDVVRQLLS